MTSYSTNQRPRNDFRYTHTQTQNQHTVRPCSTSSACKNVRATFALFFLDTTFPIKHFLSKTFLWAKILFYTKFCRTQNLIKQKKIVKIGSVPACNLELQWDIIPCIFGLKIVTGTELFWYRIQIFDQKVFGPKMFSFSFFYTTLFTPNF